MSATFFFYFALASVGSQPTNLPEFASRTNQKLGKVSEKLQGVKPLVSNWKNTTNLVPSNIKT
ncbi:hypothetical protein C1H46_045550 [Malus baccata]|uniref:Uncharacterized protein n=1 Tax=Malus baccata TaxID=106549 RepID=A0A540K3W1_MALBA|nr:hypothetical protein C1H46_045550 [Malus baccata]